MLEYCRSSLKCLFESSLLRIKLPLYSSQEWALEAELLCEASSASTSDIFQWHFLILFCVTAPTKYSVGDMLGVGEQGAGKGLIAIQSQRSDSDNCKPEFLHQGLPLRVQKRASLKSLMFRGLTHSLLLILWYMPGRGPCSSPRP